MKHVQLFEQFIGEAAKSAFGKDIAKNKRLFKEVVDALLPLVQEIEDNVTIADVEEWLVQDVDSNPEFDYLEDLNFTVDGFFEYHDN